MYLNLSLTVESPEGGLPPVIKDAKLEALFTDLGLDLYTDMAVLVICYHMKCKVQGEIHIEEWRQGFKDFGCVSALGAVITAAFEWTFSDESMRDPHGFVSLL